MDFGLKSGLREQRFGLAGLVLVAVFCVNALAGGKVQREAERADANSLPRKTLKVHFDARGSGVPDGVVSEGAGAEIGSEFAIETN